MRFLREDPWARLVDFRAAMPNLLLQMLVRSANAVGYTNYPDNVVRYFVEQAAKAGIDVFRVFDCLNWVENMKVAIEAVRRTDRLCARRRSATRAISPNPRETKYDLRYYVDIAKELKAMGAHVLGIKDMGGLCQPRAAAVAGQGAQGGSRAADSFPHARHQRYRSGERARRDRGGRRRRRRRDRRACPA
jgi:pyruvate carboxylase